MRVFTIQVAKWRLAKQYGVELLDTTVKGGYSPFAPTWDMVMGHKNGTMSDEEYKDLYWHKLVQSWKSRREDWMKIIQDPTPVALACYCKEGAFCHRLLLVEFLRKLCKQLNEEFEYFGELTNTPSESKENQKHVQSDQGTVPPSSSEHRGDRPASE